MRAQKKVEAAKKKAAAIADAPDMTVRSKMRAIEKAYKGAAIQRPGSVYVVAKSLPRASPRLAARSRVKRSRS